MSLSFNLTNTSQRALDSAILGCVREAVEFLANKHGFSSEEAFSEMNLTRSPTAKKVVKPKAPKKPSVPLPFCGTILSTCCGIRINHGLHSQCSNAKAICSLSGKEFDYCKTCKKQADVNESDGPNAGDIRSRLGGEWTPTGKLVTYGNVMEKLNISREQAETAAAEFGLTIPEEQFEVVKGRRGRPKKDPSASSSEDDETPKKRGRPKKEKKVINSSAGDDLISQLVAQAAAEETTDSSDSDNESKLATKAAKDAEKAAAAKEKADAKAAKDAERAALKKAKEDAKAAKDAEKAALKAAKEDAKAAKEDAKAAKDAEKAAKLAEKEAKNAVNAIKLVENETNNMTTVKQAMFLADLGTPSSPKCEVHNISLQSKADELTVVENKALEDEVFGSDSDGELELENSDSDEEEEEETTIDATVKEIKGTMYVMARDTKHLYGFESHEPLGKYYDEETDEIIELSDDE